MLCDLLLAEGRLSVDPKILDFSPTVDRGELITKANANGASHEEGGYKRYKITESGVSPRAIPGVPGYLHTLSSDEHDEDGVLISDEYTNATKRRAMMEKRMRKEQGIEKMVPPPVLQGPKGADVTLIGWGSTQGVLQEARELLAAQGISSNQLQIRWLVPLHGEAIVEILKDSKHTIIVENNFSGQFARYLRSETSFVPNGHIRKYDGEPFMPHHIVEAVKEQLAGNTTLSVPLARNYGVTPKRVPAKKSSGDEQMATDIVTTKQIVMADLKGRVDPDWCPGCGDFGVLAAIQKSLVELQIPTHETVVVSGIGCSSNLPGFINTYGMHTLHGRSLPVATGLKMANHALTVLVTGGDGDGFGIGCGHFVHTMRRNVDLTYIVMDNQIYGLTTGQTSPTSRKGMKTKSMPFGSVESPLNPVSLAPLRARPSWGVDSAATRKHLTELIKQAIEHKGFSFLDVFSPCVTYNHDNTFAWFRPRVKKLEEDSAYDSTNWVVGAMERSLQWGEERPHREVL